MRLHFYAVLWIVTNLFAATARCTEPILLRAGPVTMAFDVENAALRYIKVGSDEVLRGITAPIRNETWGTVRPQVSNVRLEDGKDHFTLTFETVCREGDVDFRWQGRIVGTRTGDVEFAFDGVAHSTFLRNRIGFCVLHAASAAGKPWRIEHVDGAESVGHFPVQVSPHQPAKNLRSIAHEVKPGLMAIVEFEGDVFEMEDQRNWTDASFKTYCTPLELPYPVEVKEGASISQRIRIRVEGAVPGETADDGPVVLSRGEKQWPVPRLGLQISSESDDLNERQLQLLKALRLDHLYVSVAPSEHAFDDKLRRAVREANALGVPLHVAIRLGEHPDVEMKYLVRELKGAAANVVVYLINTLDSATFELAREMLKPVAGRALIGVGCDTNFVDLNRNRPTAQMDVVSYAINPQIHAFDNASMVETLPIHAETARTAREFVGKSPLVIGPITLRPQQLSPKASGSLAADVDVRQPTLFAAGWTMGSIKYLAEAEVAGATYFETVGWKGVMELDQPTNRAAEFSSTPGKVHPVYFVLRELADFEGGHVRQFDSSAPLSIVGLALEKDGQTRILIANLTGRPQSVAVRGGLEPRTISVLDEESVSAANANADGFGSRPTSPVSNDSPLVVPPYAIARIDGGTN
ncbi:MAG: hypothetical protein WD851_04480 [Pirellulales bacterium]